jgi:DNA-directed RNA polymerase subunit K/omega
MSYLDLVEEYPREIEQTQFEKILVAARRAKDLHDHDKIALSYNHYTAPYLALVELREGKITPVYREEDPTEGLPEEESEENEEEE